jgi:hypothetical protein
MPRDREMPPVMESHTYGGVMRQCLVVTELDVTTVRLREGHFVCLALSRPDLETGMVMVMDRDEMEFMAQTMQNAMEDADLLDAGKAPTHTTGLVGTRH